MRKLKILLLMILYWGIIAVASLADFMMVCISSSIAFAHLFMYLVADRIIPITSILKFSLKRKGKEAEYKKYMFIFYVIANMFIPTFFILGVIGKIVGKFIF